MSNPAEIKLIGLNGKRGIALVDAEDYDRLNRFPWEDDPNLRVVTFREYGERWYLHRQVLEPYEKAKGGEVVGRRTGFLDGDYHNCQKSNLFLFDAGRENKRAARYQKLKELSDQGIDVSRLTGGWKFAKSNWANSSDPRVRTYVDAPEGRLTSDPMDYVRPASAPLGVRAIQTVDGSLVFVDSENYEDLARYDWRDTGMAILRGPSTQLVRLAHEVLQPGPDLIVSYIDGNHLHCWRGNLYAYRRGCKREDRRKAIRERSV